MFASRRRSIVFPQAEHARFSGALALAWAERPPLPRAASNPERFEIADIDGDPDATPVTVIIHGPALRSLARRLTPADRVAPHPRDA